MHDWRALGRLGDEDLVALDVFEVNSACAVGLPGAERIDMDFCRGFLDFAAGCVRSHTTDFLPDFWERPDHYEHSEAYFRSLCLISVLQRDLGIRYNPAKIPADVPFDTADTFAFGALQGPGGTCATLPVVYAAVGRRLGYPIKLVTAYGGTADHCFARWDDPQGERLNLEASGKGLGCPPDDYYRTGRYAVTPEIERNGGFLVSQTPRMELAHFLAHRALRWQDCGNLRDCLDSFAWAAGLAPAIKPMLSSLNHRYNELVRVHRTRKPPGFPRVLVGTKGQRLYPAGLARDVELNVLGALATETLLNDRELEARWWRHLRAGCGDFRVPTVAVVDFHAGGCDVSFEFGRESRPRGAVYDSATGRWVRENELAAWTCVPN